jgi:predicted DsbA family dithiol-disulfide isomerase
MTAFNINVVSDTVCRT